MFRNCQLIGNISDVLAGIKVISVKILSLCCRVQKIAITAQNIVNMINARLPRSTASGIEVGTSRINS